MSSVHFFQARPKRLVAALAACLLIANLAFQTVPVRAAAFVVNSSADAPDANPGDGSCATNGGLCTLRAAIMEANAFGGADTITVPAGTYTLAIAPANANEAESGDHDIFGPVTIVGASSGATIIDGGNPPLGAPPGVLALDRLFEIHPTAGNVTLKGLRIQGGWSAEDGGGIFNASPGILRLENIAVVDNHSEVEGGGIYNLSGRLLVTGSSGNQSLIANNTARGGGGIFNAGVLGETGLPARVELTNVTVSGNAAGSGGGVGNDHEGALTITDSTFTDNLAEDYGGGVANTSKASLTMTRVDVLQNRSVGDGAGVFTASERQVTIRDSHFAGNAAGVTIPDEVPGQVITGDGGGGGLTANGSGAITISGSTFEDNSAVGDGGGIAIDNNGSVAVTDVTVHNNSTESNGGGIENAGMTATFTRVTVHGNRATLDGGGIESQASGNFTILDSNIYSNSAENGGGFSNNGDGTLRIARSTFWDNRAIVGLSDDSGLGGGVYSLGDAAAEYENVTISGNLAQVRGGGFYVDADAGVRVVNSTIAFNSSPVASGVGGEVNVPTLPIYPSTSVIFRNTIVAANSGGPACNYALGSEGGNIEDGDSCYFRGLRDRTYVSNIALDAVADNGGATLTQALRPESFAIDGGVSPCVETDQRGVARPQNHLCDSGAYEYEGPFWASDEDEPDTIYLSGPVQDTENTSLFTFTGNDTVTAAEDLLYECRLIEYDPTEPPEPVDPTQPPDPELIFVGCPNPWQVPLIEDGTWTFEVRAIDRAGNVDPTPASHTFTFGPDATPPETFFLETPPNPSYNNTATFTFGGSDNLTGAQFLEFECRIDSNDPTAWLECVNPTVFSNLTTGQHTVQVRATDGGDNIDPTPATYTWTVAPPVNCEAANITLYAAEDSYVDEALPLDTFGIFESLIVRSQAAGENARALVRFDLPSALANCDLEQATLRLYADGEAGRTLQAIPLDGSWSESQVNWQNQPAATGTPATVASGAAYREWNVTTQVTSMLNGTPNHGFLIRDAAEGDAAGAEQGFISTEAIIDPPTPPQLVLRFDDSGTPPPPPPDEPDGTTGITCGQVITQSIRLEDDLLGCLGEGLVIGAPNIVVDLNGHTISSGVIVDPGQEEGLLAGIRNSGHSNVTVRNGTVRNFGYGVRLLGGATYNVVEDMTFVNNIIAGVELFDADNGRNGNTIRDNTFNLNGVGVQLLNGAENSVIENNSFNGNLGVALYMYDSSGHRIANNTISGLTNDPLLDSDGGIYLEGSSDNELIGNTLSDTGDAAILITAGSNRNRIEGNTSTRASDAGIAIDDSDDNEVVDNLLHQSGGAGVSLGNAHGSLISGNDVRFNPGGVELAGSNNNRIEGNDASYAGAAGITIEAGTDNEIVNNLASGTGADGISVEAETLDASGNPIGGFLIEGNTTNDNLGDGISVGGSGHTIADNNAYNNAALGIRAAAGNIDGGGNLASGNGEPLQCEGVVCAPGDGAPPNGADLTPPDTEILTQPANGSSTLDPATFSFTGSDNLAPATALRFECRLDAPPDPPPPPPEPGEPPQPPDVDNWLECSTPLVYNFLLAGEHTFEVRARDPGDNVDLTPASYTWTVVAAPPGNDPDAPNTTITERPSNPSTSTTATFRFSGSDNSTPGPNLVYECRMDGAPFAVCYSPITYSGLSVGAHSFEVRARDAQNNLDPTPASYSWTVQALPTDVTPPETTITSQPDLTTVSTAASFSFSSNEQGGSFECALDGGEYTSCSSPHSYSGLDIGAHSFAVRAVDAAGNTDPTPATFSWTITPAAVPTTVSCGQVIVQNIVVLNDLLACPENGLVIGANNITIDLDGRTIGGVGLGVGVLNNGFDSVTIRNGVINGFDYGVHLTASTSRNIVEGLTVQLNQIAGIALTNADEAGVGNTVRNNAAGGNADGILIENGTTGALVLNNEIGASSGYGMYVLASSGNRFEGNLVSASSDVGVNFEGSSDNTLIGNEIVAAADTAFALSLGSNRNRIESNTVSESEAGIIVDASNGNELINNTVSGSSDNGITLESANNNLLRGNDVRFNTGGIAVGGSSGNTIEQNNASETDGTGIEVGDSSFENVIRQNQASGNAAEGISIGGEAPAGLGNRIENNTASNNGADGIAANAVGHMITSNSANNNGGWGIYSALGTIAGVNIDGGGNRALGNVGGGIDPATGLTIQCFNIRCDGGEGLPTDQVAPETSINQGPSNPSTFTMATFHFTGFDNASPVQFQCSLNGAPFNPCASPTPYSGLALGAHTFAVRAVDYSGNIDSSPATYTWTVEAPAPGVPPETTIDSAPDVSTASTSASFTFSANEEGATFECALDGGSFTACSSPHSLSGLAVGAHTFAVRAVDSENLADPTPASWSWTITAAPVATTVSCGQLITQSILVQNDLLDCSGNGLVIGANGITVDLNGHTIDGINLGIGILNNGFDNVTITNGTLQEFDFGVQLNAGTAANVVAELNLPENEEAGIQLANADQNGNGNTIRNNTITGSIQGIALIDGTTAALVRNNSISATADNGVYLLNSSGNRVENNSLLETSGAGIALENANTNTLLGNTLTRNSGGGIVIGADLLPANNNRIEGNTIAESGSAGISIIDSSGNQLITNRVSLAGSDGIGLEGAQNSLLRGNVLTSNSGGIGLLQSSGNRIEANNVSANSGTGIALESLSINNVIIGNVVSTNSGDGIYVGDSAPAGQGNVIENNIVNGNGSNGILVSAAQHTITGNAVNFNDGWGINAVPGTIDGGGNVASANAEPQQCFGVVCSIGTAPGAPDTEIVEKPANPTNSRNALFTFTGEDDITETQNLGFECRLDSTSDLAWVECDNPAEYTNLAPGSHTFEVRAVDELELADPTPASYTWVYTQLPIGVPPDTFINQGPPLVSSLYEAIFTFSSNEPDVTYQCSLDGAPFTTCAFAAEYEFEEFQVGQHTFRVRAIDFEGNIDPTPASYTWTILGAMATITDGPAYIAPEQVGESAEGGETEETTATFTFESNIADSTFMCSMDLGQFVNCSSPVTYTGLAVGEHIFRVIAIDPEGREQLEPTEYGWTIIPALDTVPPDTSITGTPTNGSSEVIFAFAGLDNVTSPAALTFECRLDSTLEADFVACESPLNLLTLFPDFAPGPHTFDVRAIDAEDNIDPTPASYSWTSVADSVAPLATILTGPFSPTIALDAVLTFNASDNATPVDLLVIECSLNGEPFVECASPYEIQVEPGLHTVEVRATDLSGNVATPASYSWLVVGPPVTTIVSGPPATSVATSATFVFTADQAGSTFECSLNGAAFQACSSPLELTNLGGGSYTLAIQAINSYGLIEVTPVEYSWTVTADADVTPPDTTIVSSPPITTTAATATFTFVSSELGASFECQLDGLGFTSCESPATVQDLLGGEHTFEVRAIDQAGNIDPTPASYTWTVEGPPVTTILTGPEAITESTEATFTFTSSVPGSTFECSLDGGAAVPCASPQTYTGLSVGPHILLVYATAPDGYVDADGPEYEWEIVPLDTTLTAGPAALTTETTASFAFTSPVPGATFECSLDGGAFESCVSPAELTGLSLGEHTFRVRAVSPTNGADSTPASYSWTVEDVLPPDTTPPQTLITTNPPTTTTSTEAIFTFSASELGATFQCSLDGGPFEACESPLILSDLTLGAHSFAVQATDLIGNTDLTPATYDWEVVADITAPETTITAGPSGQNGDTDVVFQFSGNDDTSLPANLSFECSLDGGPFEPCDTPHPLQALAIGEHTFAVRATDESGNIDPTPATRTWTLVDLIAPETTITAQPEDVSTDTTATFSFEADEPDTTFECALDGADFGSCASPVTYSSLAVGTHTFQVRAIDGAGNPDTTPASYAWTVVAPVAPNTTITSSPADPTETRIATFGFSSDQPGVTFECSFDGGAFVECETPYELENLAVGPHELLVRAVDALTNVDLTPASYSWTIIAVAPDTTIVSGPPLTTYTNEAIFGFITDEAGSTFECSLDGAPFTECESPVELSGLSAAVHTFEVRAVDLAGNIDPTPASYTWTVEPANTPVGSDIAVQFALPGSLNANVTFDQVSVLGNTTITALGSAPPLPAGYVQLGSQLYDIETTASFVGPITVCFDYNPASFADPTEVSILHFDGSAWVNATTSNDPVNGRVCGLVSSLSPFAIAESAPTETPTVSTATATDTPTVSTATATDTAVPPSATTTNTATATSTFTPVPPTATAVACVPATVTYQANADAWVDQGSASNNYGTDSILKVQSKSPNNNFRAAVRFALPSSVPPGCVIESATLRLFSASSTTGRTLQAVRLSSSWTESGITWTNQPATTGTAATTASGSGYREWNVTTQVQAMFGPNANHGFLIRDAVENSGSYEQQLHSREKGESMPQLVVRYAAAAPATLTPVPPTATPSNTVVASTSTPTPSDTPVPPTATAIPSDTPVPPTATPSNTVVTSTSTPTPSDTPVPPTATVIPSDTPVPPTATVTPSDTPVPPTVTATPSDTPVPPTATVTPSDTPVPPTATATPSDTPVPPTTTVMPSDTVVASTSTPTPSDTVVASTSTPTPSDTPVPPTATATPSDTPVPPTATPVPATATVTPSNTPVPPTATPVPPTATVTPSNTPVPPTATPVPPTATTATTPTPACVATTVTYQANADAWIDQNSSSNNYGSDSILKVQSKRPRDNFRALVRFALPTNVPTGCVVESATLRMYAASSTSGRTLQAMQLATTWTEQGVTWLNQPATIGTPVTTTSGSGYRQWNVTAQVQAMFGPNANHGFLIRDAVEGNSGAEQQLHSREKGENMPQLVVRFASPSGGMTTNAVRSTTTQRYMVYLPQVRQR